MTPETAIFPALKSLKGFDVVAVNSVLTGRGLLPVVGGAEPGSLGLMGLGIASPVIRGNRRCSA